MMEYMTTVVPTLMNSFPTKRKTAPMPARTLKRTGLLQMRKKASFAAVQKLEPLIAIYRNVTQTSRNAYLDISILVQEFNETLEASHAAL
jgi:hypothetical protein